MPEDDGANPQATDDDASRPVTHAEFPELMRSALTDFFGEGVGAGGGDPAAGDDGGDGFASMDEIKGVIKSQVEEAVNTLMGKKSKAPAGKAPGVKKAAARREPEAPPEQPKRVDLRRRFWGLR